MSKLTPIHVLSLEGELKCKICNQMSISPIYTCFTGHVVCGTCISTNKRCRHKCPDPLIPSFFAERLVRKHDVWLKCRNTEPWGCREYIKSWEMKDHVEKCIKRKGMGVKCWERSGVGCGGQYVYMNLNRFAEHLRDYHRCFQATKTVESDDWFNTFSVTRTLDHAKDYVQPSTIFNFDDKYFVLHEVHKKSTIYWWMTVAADENRNQDDLYAYNFCLKMSNKVMPLFEWNLPVLLLRIYQNCFKVQMTDTRKFANRGIYNLKSVVFPEETSPYFWKIDVKITKTEGNQGVTEYGIKRLHNLRV